ncbi:MAG: hypothetical protein K0R60_62 [Microbacterium sp.]|jgi:hypothetical protein|nr:hypothetical protein [Microbacterium sp.]
MSTTDQAPLVRTRHGAILGVDWRRAPGMTRGGVVVPGAVPVWAVMPGDTVSVGELRGEQAVVQALPRESRMPGVMHFTVQTEGGAEIVLERHRDDRVEVVEAGAFDV